MKAKVHNQNREYRVMPVGTGCRLRKLICLSMSRAVPRLLSPPLLGNARTLRHGKALKQAYKHAIYGQMILLLTLLHVFWEQHHRVTSSVACGIRLSCFANHGSSVTA